MIFTRLMLAVATTHASSTAVDTAGYNVDSLRRDLPALVVVDSSKYGFSVNVDSLAPSRSLAALVRIDRRYVLFLTMHAIKAPWDSVDLHGSRANVKELFIRSLGQDSQYLSLLSQTVARLHRASRTSPPDARVPIASALRSVDPHTVQDVAARFFYPDEILPNGRIRAHVCVSINGIADMQRGRDPAMEAFAFSAIFDDLDRGRFNVDADFREASRMMNAMDLAAAPTVRLQRAQGVMWGYMLRSERLRRVLAAKYARARHYLPFRIAA
ncbi:MAG: hypothetical protein ABI664_09515 [bacterium]